MPLLKSFYSCLLAALSGFLLLSGQPLPAAETDLDSVTWEQMAKEPPLTQNDYDLFVEFSFFCAFGVRADIAKNQEQADSARTIKEMRAKFITSQQVTAARMRFITEKIKILKISQSNPAALPQPDSALAFLIPSSGDTELYLKNASQLESLNKTLLGIYFGLN